MGWFILAVIITIGIVAFLCSDAGLNCLALSGLGCAMVAVASVILIIVLIAIGCTAAMVTSA